MSRPDHYEKQAQLSDAECRQKESAREDQTVTDSLSAHPGPLHIAHGEGKGGSSKIKVILKGLRQSVRRPDLCTVVVAVTEPLQLEGVVGWVQGGGLKAQHGSIWGTRITALNQLKVLG